MAERDRLTNKERRAQAREERRRKEEEAAQRRKRNQLRNGIVTFAIVGVVAAVLIQAFTGGVETFDDTVVIAASDVEQARSATGCETLAQRQPLPERFHFEANQAPNPDTIYTDLRPTHSGPHTFGIHPITAASSRQISEIATTHNLEHGSVIVWWDPDQIDRSTANAIGEWAETLNGNGFRSDVGGVGIMTSPFEEPGISSGKAIALRAWGTAVDCDQWDELIGYSFVLDHFGTNGIGPERNLAPFPTEILAYDPDDRPGSPEPATPELDEDELAELD